MSNDLTYYERQKLEWLLRTKQSLRSISKVMRRDVSILSREIKRNGESRRKYRADVAQRLHDARRHKKRRGKLERYDELREYVKAKLMEDWSPEQIAGRLKTCPPAHLKDKYVSHESIYAWIYDHPEKEKKLYKHLRTHRSKRRAHGRRKPAKDKIPGKVPISQRPTLIAQKQRIGDWESDTMEGTKRDKVCVSAQYERKSQLVRLHKVPDQTAEETNTAIEKTIDSLPLHMIKSITFDNGRESTKHASLRDKYNIATYHCDPYSPWQKGGVENIIKLVRQYIPKKTPISGVSDEQLKTIEHKLNNRPRKSLNYKTPNEVLLS